MKKTSFAKLVDREMRKHPHTKKRADFLWNYYKVDLDLLGLSLPVQRGRRKTTRTLRASQEMEPRHKSMATSPIECGFAPIFALPRKTASHFRDPEFIPGYFDRRDKRTLKENQVITIEPFISSGGREVLENGDGWTLVTEPGVFTAQYEHTLVITKDKPLIMTLAD